MLILGRNSFGESSRDAVHLPRANSLQQVKTGAVSLAQGLQHRGRKNLYLLLQFIAWQSSCKTHFKPAMLGCELGIWDSCFLRLMGKSTPLAKEKETGTEMMTSCSMTARSARGSGQS